jgi:hypothetical protein
MNEGGKKMNEGNEKVGGIMQTRYGFKVGKQCQHCRCFGTNMVKVGSKLYFFESDYSPCNFINPDNRDTIYVCKTDTACMKWATL